MGRNGLIGAVALLALTAWDAPPERHDASLVRCYATDVGGAVFYSSAAFPGEESHLDGDYLAFTAELRHRYRVDVDDDSGVCVAAADEKALKARIETAWTSYRNAEARRVDTGWKPDRVRN